MKYLYLFIILGVVSCQNNSSSRRDAAKMDVSMDDSNIKDIEVDSTEFITLKVKDAKVIKDIGELIEDIQYIPLETNNNSLIGRIDKMIFHNGRFYLLDSRVALSVFIFNEDGSHYRTIKNVGRGPQEYLSLKNMTIDKYNDELVLYDRNDGLLHYYDLDGNFKKKERCGVRFDDIVRINKEDFLVCLAGDWNIHIPSVENYYFIIGNPSGKVDITGELEQTGEIKQRGFYLDNFDRKPPSSSITQTHIYGDGILLSVPFSNRIYYISPSGKVSLRYQFIFENGSPQIYRNIRDSRDIQNFHKEMSARKIEYLLGHKIEETDNYLLVRMTTSGEPIRHFIYYKNAKMSFITTKEFIPSRTLSSMSPEFTDGNSFYSFTTYTTIKDHAKGEAQFPDNWKMPEVLDKVDESDNPILIRFTLKAE